mgnify:CR=1 FL=1
MNIQDELKNAVGFMDDKGRGNAENNSTMLWNDDWERLRSLLAKCATRPAKVKEREYSSGYYLQCLIIPLDDVSE